MDSLENSYKLTNFHFIELHKFFRYLPVYYHLLYCLQKHFGREKTFRHSGVVSDKKNSSRINRQ